MLSVFPPAPASSPPAPASSSPVEPSESLPMEEEEKEIPLWKKYKDWAYETDPWDNSPFSKEGRKGAKKISYDWFIEIAEDSAYSFASKSVPLAIMLFDMYLSERVISFSNQVQLYICASLIVASKYLGAHDEKGSILYPIDMEFLSDNSYSVKQIIKAETDLLQAIKYRLELYTLDHFMHEHKSEVGEMSRKELLSKWIELLISHPSVYSLSAIEQYRLAIL